jgi:hypothetical protein
MEYIEFRRQLGKAGLTNLEFADMVKINSNSLTNYKKSGEVPSHWAIVALLMGHMSDNKLDFKEVIKSIEIKPNKTRGTATKGRFGGSRQNDLVLINQGSANE